MTSSMITLAMETLQAAGIPATRGYPGRLLPTISSPVAAVSIHKALESQVTLAVYLYCGEALGGSCCEDASLTACQALRDAGAACIQEGCQYDAALRAFGLRILATWDSAGAAQPLPESGDIQCTVTAGGTALSYVTGVTAQYTVDLNPVQAMGQGAIGMRWDSTCWDVTVEQLLPFGTMPDTTGYSTFSLVLTRPGGTETYPDCRWVSIRCKDTPNGVAQTRVARSWGQREVSNG